MREGITTENLIFSLNATAPVFLMMLLGYFLNRLHVIDDAFAKKLNKFVFSFAMPVHLFKGMTGQDFRSVWNMEFVAVSFLLTLLSVFIMLAASWLLPDKSVQAEFVQAGHRGSQVLLGGATPSLVELPVIACGEKE